MFVEYFNTTTVVGARVTGLDDLALRVRGNLEAAILLSQQAGAIEAELRELTGVGQSKNRFVRVTVEYRGFVTGLTLAPSATEESTGTLGQDVMEATQLAIAELQEKATAIRAQLTVDPALLANQDDIAEELDELVQTLFPPDRTPETTERKS